MTTDWRREIAILAYVKDAIFKLDTHHLWRQHLPRVGASAPELASAERCIGDALVPEYRQFLETANGWPAFYQDVDLFGTEELCGGGLMRRARELLGVTADHVFLVNAVSRDQLLPIAVSATDLDLFVLSAQAGEANGSVLWLAGDLVERFGSFESFFLAMTDYNRVDYERMRQTRSMH